RPWRPGVRRSQANSVDVVDEEMAITPRPAVSIIEGCAARHTLPVVAEQRDVAVRLCRTGIVEPTAGGRANVRASRDATPVRGRRRPAEEIRWTVWKPVGAETRI